MYIGVALVGGLTAVLAGLVRVDRARKAAEIDQLSVERSDRRMNSGIVIGGAILVMIGIVLLLRPLY